LETFQPTELEKFRFAKELFDLKQQPEQSVDAFITQIKVKVALVGMDAKSQMWAALNGLLPHISAYVIEHAPEFFDDILKHARIVEMTRGM
jgi:predicted NAD/FAD-binding protein